MHAKKLTEAKTAYDNSIALSAKVPPETVRQQSAFLMALTCRSNLYFSVDKNPQKARELSDLAFETAHRNGTAPLDVRTSLKERIILFRQLGIPNSEIDQLEHESQKYDRLRGKFRPDPEALLQ